MDISASLRRIGSRWLRSPDPPRARAAALASMGIGALLAALGLLHRAPPWLTRVPPGYVALVNQHGILMNDFISRTATELEEPFVQATAAQRAQVLHEMIDRELLVQRALALDLPETTTEVRTAMADAVANQVGEAVETQPPTEAQLRVFFESHRQKYATEGRMLVRDLVLRTGAYQGGEAGVAAAQADAVEAVYRLRSGASIEDVMAHYGFVDADSPPQNAQPDYAASSRLGPTLFAAATQLSTGEVSDPIIQSDGVHVLVMLERSAPQLEDFLTARLAVYNDYVIDQKQRARQALLESLRSHAQIILAPGQSE